MPCIADTCSHFRLIVIVSILLIHLIHHRHCYNHLGSNTKTKKILNVNEYRRYKRKSTHTNPQHDLISKSILIKTSNEPKGISENKHSRDTDGDTNVMKFSNQSMYHPKYPSYGIQSKERRSIDKFRRNKEGTGDNIRTQKIIGGRITSIDRHPWFVSVWKKRGRSAFFRCGGSIISERWVLTAAHCLEDGRKGHASVLRNDQVKVMAGTNVKKFFTRRHGRLIYNISAVHLHPAWKDANTYMGDLGLLQIEGSFDLSENSKMGIICLSSTPTINKSVDECISLGMGIGSDFLLKSARAPIVYEQLNCTENVVKLQFKGNTGYRRYSEEYTADKVCAGEDIIDKPGFCDGDSGSPLVCRHGDRWLQEGVSHASLTQCREKAGYDVYTCVKCYIDWITDTVGALPPPTRCGQEKIAIDLMSSKKIPINNISSGTARLKTSVTLVFTRLMIYFTA